MHRCKYNKFASCNIKECDTCEAYKFYQQGRADATKELPTSLYCDGFNDGYEKGRADGYSQAENDYHKQTEKDRQSSYDCGYQQGRADKYQEIVSGYMLLTENQVAEIRADAIDEFANKLIDELHYNVSAKPVTIHTPYATPIMIDGEIQKVAEQLKNQK